MSEKKKRTQKPCWVCFPIAASAAADDSVAVRLRRFATKAEANEYIKAQALSAATVEGIKVFRGDPLGVKMEVRI